MNKPFILTESLVSKVLETVDAGLSSGLGSPSPGNMCVEAAVCYAMGLPHGDNPTCVSPVIRRVKIGLNDSNWSSKKTRAQGMRRLAVLQLGTKDNFDQVDFSKRLALMTIKTILPIILTAAGLTNHADACANVTTLAEGGDVARAADAAAYSAAAAAYSAAAYSADAYSADAAVRDKTLQIFATGVENILIDMKVPAVLYLSLIDNKD